MHSKRQSLASTTSSSGSLMHVKNSEVVKRGCLYVKRPPSNNPVKIRFKTWQKRHLVLRDMLTQDGDPLLELYTSESAANSSVEEESNGGGGGGGAEGGGGRGRGRGGTVDQRRCSINLRNVIYVDVYKDSRSFQHAFIVVRAGKTPVIFGAKTDLEMREWMVAIKLMADKVVRLWSTMTHDGTLTPCRQSADPKYPSSLRVESRSTLRRDDLVHRSTPMLLENGSPRTSAKILHQSSTTSSRDRLQDNTTSSESNSKYLVKIQKTEDATLHQLTGEYHMIVTESEISLRTPTSTDDTCCISWPLQHIRKLKSESKADGFGDLITLVANSRCGQYQGTYTFRIPSGVDLIRKVRLFVKKLESNDSSCRRQQRDMAMLKSAASTALDKLMPSLRDESNGSACPSLQSLVESSGSSSGSRLDHHDDSCTSSPSGQSSMYFFTGNSYVPLVDDIGNTASTKQPLSGSRSMTLSRSMGSIAILSANTRHTDSGFESADEVVSSISHPPVPPPRPVHTIGLN